jgi:hypothetical protein
LLGNFSCACAVPHSVSKHSAGTTLTNFIDCSSYLFLVSVQLLQCAYKKLS